MPDHQFDRIDQRILRELQQDARLSTAQLAERIALTPSPIWRRIKALETEGVIRGYHADINPKKIGYGVTAYVSILLESRSTDLGVAFEQAVLNTPEILSCDNISGHFDFILKVIAKDLDSFGDFARDKIRNLPGVKEMNSSFSLKQVKHTTELPIFD